jgi:hypothetical protein
MSDHDADRDGMDPNEFTDDDLELHLSGREPHEPGNEDLAAFLSEVKAVYAKGPDERTVRARVAEIVAAAERTAAQRSAPISSREPPTRPRIALPRRRVALLIAAVVLGALLLMAALAAAGVNLPGVVRAPFDRFATQQPSQAEADSVKGVIDSTPPDQRDCSFGQQVASAAGAASGGPSDDPCSQQGTEGAAPGPHGDASSGRSFGQQTSASARQGASGEGRAFGEQTSHAAAGFGQSQASTSPPPAPQSETSNSAPQSETSRPAPPSQSSSSAPQSQTGQGIAEQHSQAGQQHGKQQSQTAQANGQAASQTGHAIAGAASGGHGP